jgi:hypothetical protein
MIVTKLKPYNKIKSQLKKTDEVGIISCNACARMCDTGGEKRMKEIAKKLKRDGFNVVDMDLIGAPCNFDLLNKSQLHGNVQVVLACDAGVYNLKKIFPKHKIIAALDTIGVGAFDNKGHITLVKRFK